MKQKALDALTKIIDVKNKQLYLQQRKEQSMLVAENLQVIGKQAKSSSEFSYFMSNQKEQVLSTEVDLMSAAPIDRLKSSMGN